MDLTDVLNVCRAGLFVDLKRAVTVADYSLGTADPWVVVTEDAGVLLVSRGIAGNFAQLKVILGVSGLQQHNAVLRVQLAFLALLAADHMSKGIVKVVYPR